jgi:hypothetical protein
MYSLFQRTHAILLPSGFCSSQWGFVALDVDCLLNVINYFIR